MTAVTNFWAYLNNTATYFNVYAPGSGPGGEALAVSEQVGPMVPELNVFEGLLPISGVYSISVYLFRNAARRGETSNYDLEISIAGETGAIVEGDFADGLMGGPDFWRVSAGGGLNLRSAPSAGADILMTLPNGLELRNLGCRMAEGRRWCQVTPIDSQLTGWVAGDYLVEASGGMATQLPSMTPVPQGNLDRPIGGVRPEGSGFTATGLTECSRTPGAPMQTCEFGVVREGNGSGMVLVFWPEGGSRAVYYADGAPVSYDQSQADGGAQLTATRQADAYLVVIGDQRVLLPDAIIFGG
jgi:hypothetical protein